MKRVSPYLKMRVLGAIEFAEGKSIRERIRQVSNTTFEDEEGRPFRFTWRTISTWLYRYKLHGTEGLETKPRTDKGKLRKVELEEVQEAIDQVKGSFTGKTINKTAIYRACIEKGLLRRERIAPNTFSRLVNEFELLKPLSECENPKRLAFSKKNPNEMWQADTMYGPYVSRGGAKVQTKLICFLDDCSRVVCHGEFFFSDNTDNLMKAFRSALYKRGIPEQLYVDNGSNYASKEMTMICVRIGCLLCHTPVRDGAAKGKIERFFRTVRGNFLSRRLELDSLESLNQAFSAWIEEEYNNRIHSVIQMKPIDRFGLGLPRIRFLPPNQANDELFYVEDERRVLADNTFSLRNIRFEAPRDLRGRKIQVRWNRQNFEGHCIVYYKGERMGESRPVDFHLNDRRPSVLREEINEENNLKGERE